jgi:DMSO/TMAO reductase YedYZ molybdopterin-dependent catalytic subunit
MSPALSTRFKGISRVLSIQTARSLHFLVFCWFLFFIVVHVSLVFTTGLLVNLNHIGPGRDDNNWLGFWVFIGWMTVVVVGWVAATPFTLRHPRVVQRVGYALIGPVQRWFEHVDVSPGQYSEKDISPYFWHNGRYPDTAEYRALEAGDFADYRLHVGGLVANPVELSLADLRRLPRHEQITQHFCIQGWSGVAKWGGVSMTTILDLASPDPQARWAVFYSLGEGADGGSYYDAHPIEQMRSPLAMLAYEMNDEPLSFGHGAPLRLRNELQLGFKQVKWISGVEFVADFAAIGSGYGGYNQDHEFFGYRQSISDRPCSDRQHRRRCADRSVAARAPLSCPYAGYASRSLEAWIRLLVLPADRRSNVPGCHHRAMAESNRDRDADAREKELDRREAALGARITEAESILEDAEGRDADAAERDEVAAERDREEDLKAFLSRDVAYGDDAPLRRHAAIDRGHAKGDRVDSAEDRQKLTEDLDNI